MIKMKHFFLLIIYFKISKLELLRVGEDVSFVHNL